MYVSRTYPCQRTNSSNCHYADSHTSRCSAFGRLILYHSLLHEISADCQFFRALVHLIVLLFVIHCQATMNGWTLTFPKRSKRMTQRRHVGTPATKYGDNIMFYLLIIFLLHLHRYSSL